MANKRGLAFAPDYATPPGDTLQDAIDALNMTQAELASRTDLTPKTINEIIAGKAPITAETALHLERVLGVPASFWINLEANFQEAKARRNDRAALEDEIEWMRKIPVREMINAGWIDSYKDKVEQIRAVLSFFGVTSPKAWDESWLAPAAEFRRSPSFEANPGSVAAWLRFAEIQAQKVQCQKYEKSAFLQELGAIRALTVEPVATFLPKMKKACAKSGVALVFVPEIKGTVTSGATRWLSPDKAMISLSLRHKQNDHFWFTFFHEAGHVILHGKKKIFIEAQKPGTTNDQEEHEANRFARDQLIPLNAYGAFRATGSKSQSGIIEFARQIGIAPGIVVGRLQHDGVLPRSHLNKLKIKLEWTEEFKALTSEV